MAVDLDLLCSTLAIPIEKLGNNPNVTRCIRTAEQNFKLLAQEAQKDLETGRPNASKLGGDVEIIYIREG